MNLYMVEVKTFAVVVAEDELHARSVAESHAREAINDADPDCRVLRRVESENDLDEGWDGRCIAYGGDGNTTISELLEGDQA